ncbi:MAG TPA: zinc-dependent metalloprotease [Kofleriaceae bacterium]|nr:zinc-dependent metalloprotease [Kofleriaceae bacterium]
MFTKAVVLAMLGSALLSGCAVEAVSEGADETQEIIDNLVQAGYPERDIMVEGGAVYVGRDAHVTLQASREMLESGGEGEEQYRTSNLVSSSVTRICVWPSADFTGSFSTALDYALANYTVLPLTFDMVRGPAVNCMGNIVAVIEPGLVGGSAGFPANGLPYGQITIGGGLAPYGVNVIEHVITHELGHTIGFRHSDYYDRSISCGVGGNEGSAGVGAIWIPGTPTTATVGGSIMNSCFRSVETGEFTSSDVTALNYLY